MERKLASIQKIINIEPIENADNIEKLTILGWQLVSKKEQFKIGDLCVYCEIDSILPDKPEFEFLRPRKFRIKTIKLRGQISQGLCLPLSILPANRRWVEGDEVTKIIGVKKHDPQAEAELKEIERIASIRNNRIFKFFKRYSWVRRLFIKNNRYNFPAFIRKTDEERVQNLSKEYPLWKDLKFDITEKLDGTSATYFLIKNKGISRLWKPYIFGVCSRNFHLIKNDGSVYWKIAKKLDIKKKLTRLADNGFDTHVLQGEIVGKGVQKNHYKLDDIQFYIFDLYKNNIRFNYSNMKELCKYLQIQPVPYITETTLPDTIEEAVNYSKGKSILNSKIDREGIVVRNLNINISFKIINPNFLLKYEE